LSSALEFFRCGWLAYKSLLTWLALPNFLAVKLLNPAGQVTLLTTLGVYASGYGAAPLFLVGNAVVLTAFGGLYGTSIVFGQAKATGILRYATTGPRSRTWITGSVVMFSQVDGLLTGFAVTAIGLLLVGHSPAAWGPLVTAMAVGAITAGMMGLLVSQVSLAISADRGVLMNVTFFLTLLLSRANVTREQLPSEIVRVVSDHWPLTRSVEVARAATMGGRVEWWLLVEELVGAGVVLLLSLLLVHYLERRSRSKGTLDPWM
jgi:hypothetical protein